MLVALSGICTASLLTPPRVAVVGGTGKLGSNSDDASTYRMGGGGGAGEGGNTGGQGHGGKGVYVAFASAPRALLASGVSLTSSHA